MTDWEKPPADTLVEIDDGSSVLLPRVDEALKDIAIGDGGTVKLVDVYSMVRWLTSLRDDEVAAGHQYFTDRWLWDSGHPTDKFFRDILEKEHRRRRQLTQNINLLSDELDSTSSVNTQVLPETINDTNS